MLHTSVGSNEFDDNELLPITEIRVSWLDGSSEGVSDVNVDVHSQSDNLKATVGPGSVLQQEHLIQMMSAKPAPQSPSVVNYPAPEVNPYEGFSEEVFTVVDAYPQKYAYPKQYFEQYGTSNQQAVAVAPGSVLLQQQLRQMASAIPAPQSPSVVFYPTTEVNPYEGRPFLTWLNRIFKWKLCFLSFFTRCY
ncbi:unnamed protein product [Danaus chrysippus]|uniref:(African queen) hypothetical protein n=1 Tax=Danaus chrysippus TaxID=151541 RepID=A0A8J2QMN9_9NEOP|nr:unnamed protein product [Danaus chrysippus]